MINFICFIFFVVLCIVFFVPIIENYNESGSARNGLSKDKVFYSVAIGNGYYKEIVRWIFDMDFCIYLVNSKGEVVKNLELKPIPFKSDWVYEGFWNGEVMKYEWFYHGYMIAEKMNKEKVLLDMNLEIVDFPYKGFSFENMEDGYILAMDDGYYGVVDDLLNTIIPVKYQKCRYLGGNKFEVSEDGKTKILKHVSDNTVVEKTRLEGEICKTFVYNNRKYYIVVNNGKYGCYDGRFNKLISLMYDSLNFDKTTGKFIATKGEKIEFYSLR